MNTPGNANKALWEKNDFTRIADSMRESGKAPVQRIGIMKAMRVLDLGCGDGTTALPAAKLGALDAAENGGKAAQLQKELEQLFESKNTNPEAPCIPATFLCVTVVA
jgi:cyclopropane fatty-acyl-phospholipid synthase-like methyltransferase